MLAASAESMVIKPVKSNINSSFQYYYFEQVAEI